MNGLIADLFTNSIFLSIFLAGLISQSAKILMIILKHKQKFQFRDLIATGGMPSTHSAFVGSLMTIVWLDQGFSPLFFAVFTFSIIVLRDSIGVRRSVGEEGKLIEKIIKHENIKTGKFHFSLGHNPKEVLVGLIIGFFSAIFSYFIL